MVNKNKSKEVFDKIHGKKLNLVKPKNDTQLNETNQIQEIPKINIIKNESEICIVLAHIKTEKQKELLIKCLSSIKIEKILSCNSVIDTDIQLLTDWCIYDKKNELLLRSEYDDYNVRYFHWKRDENGKIETRDQEFEHGYAAYNLIKNGLLFAKCMGKEICHIINYDYIISPKIIEDNFKQLKDNDMVVIHNPAELNSYLTSFFSGRVDSLLKFFKFYKNKKEYYSHIENNKFNTFIIEGKFWNFYKNSGDKIIKKNIKELTDDPDTIIDGHSAPVFDVISEPRFL